MSFVSDKDAQQMQSDSSSANTNSQKDSDKKEGDAKTGKSAGQLYYLAPLNGFSPKDLTAIVEGVNKQLADFDRDLNSLSQSAASPVNGNLFAPISAASMLLDKLSDNPSSGKDYSAIAIDLLGCLTGEDAQTVTVIRPILHKVRDACLRNPKGSLKASDIKLFDDHMHTLKAGELKKLIVQSQGKLSNWLSGADALAQSSLQALTLPVTPKLPSSKSASNSSKSWYQPEKTHASIWQALLTVTEQQKEDPTKNIKDAATEASAAVSSTVNTPLTTKISKLQATLTKEINAQSGTKEGQVGFYFKKLLEALEESAEVKKDTAVVDGQPAQVVEEKKEGIVEALATVAPTEGCSNDCKDGNCGSATGGSIGFALGEERISQLDFVLTGNLPLVWDRVYRSNLITYDKGALGARWTNGYLSRIDIRKNEWLLNTADGRIVKLPKLKVGDIHRDVINGFNLMYLDEDLISITFGRDQLQLFQKQGEKHYKLALIRDGDHNNISLSYDNQHRLALVNNQTDGHCLTFGYTPNQRVAKVHLHQMDKDTQTVGDRIRTVAQYEYDKQGNLISATDENNDKRTFEYDNYHRVTRYTDRTGFGMNLQWQGRRHKGKAVSEHADDGSRAMKLSWTDGLRATTLTNALGQNLNFFCDIDGYPVRNILPDGREEWFFRDASKNIIKQITADGRATSFTYDETDNLLSITANDSSKTFFEYNEAGRLVRTTDANGHQSRNQYDSKGNIVKSFDPKGRITQYEYNEQSLMTAVTDPRGGVNTFEYNESGQLIKQTDCSNKSIEYSYNDQGQLFLTKDAEGHVVKYDYNERGQLTKTIYPDNKFVQYNYDVEGRPLSSKDSTGRESRTEYTAGFIPFMTVDTIGRKISSKRDQIGKPVQLTDANGSVYRWQYHPQTNQLLKETSFTGKNTQYQHDPKTGELIQSQEDGGNPIRYEYDELGRLSKRYTDTLTEQFIYDQMGQLIVAKNTYSKNQYFYDEVGNLIKEIQDMTQSESDREQKESLQYIWQYEYDVLGNRTVTIRPDGQRIDYLTYGSGHIHGVLLNKQPLVDYERDDIHREISRSLGNQIEQQYQFDKAGYLKQQKLAGKLAQQKDYTYNKQGLIRQISDHGKGTQTYEYDLVGRLIHAKNKDTEERFYFDPANNLLDPLSVASQQTGNHTHNYDLENRFPNSHATADYRVRADINYKRNRASSNLLNEFNGNQYEYDLRGNLIKKVANGETTLFEWNDFNQLIQLHNNKGTTHYRYDTMGRRIYKRTPDNKEIYAIWDGDTLAIEESNRQTRHYLYEPDSFAPLAQLTINHHKQQQQAQQVYYYHNDYIGAPEMMTNQDGNIVWEGTKKAFGQTRAESKVFGLINNIRFIGQYYDEESGLHYNRYRYYEPETGKYISEDPIKLAGGINAYGYPVNPVHMGDPLGLIEWEGTAYNAGVAVVEGGWYQLRSQCVNGRMARVNVKIIGGSKGKGLFLGSVGSNVTFEDGLDHIDPTVFNGIYTSGNAGISFFKGIGVGSIQIGRAESKGLFTFYNRGHLASIAASAGYAKVTSSSTDSCRAPAPPLTKEQKAERKKQTEEGARLIEEMKRNGQYPTVPPSGQWFPGM